MQVLALQQRGDVFAKAEQLVDRQADAGDRQDDHGSARRRSDVGARQRRFGGHQPGAACLIRFSHIGQDSVPSP
jgi:hypothetical protein